MTTIKHLAVGVVMSSCLLVLASGALHADKLGPLQVGEEVVMAFATAHPYDAAPGPEAAVVFSQEIHFPGATYIAPHFSHFDLAPGDFVVVRSPDDSRSWVYEKQGKGDLGIRPEGFWGIHIAGDTAIVELHSLTGGGFGFEIDKIARGFTDAEMGIEPEPESVCGTDDSEEATCYESSNPTMYQKARAVARLLINGTGRCTGWLLGCEGHVMTNEHCIGNASDAANTDFEFMAEGPNCATDCTSSGACAGDVQATTSTVVKIDAPLDYALVDLPTDVSGLYGFMQLKDAVPGVGTDIWIPQHPSGWGKRIALESSHPNNPDGFGEIDSTTENGCQTGGPQDLGYYLDTRGGSSGSPVLNVSENLVVGLHHCRGSVSCTNTGGDANRGVKITEIIDDLGSDLPMCAVPGCEFIVTADRETVRPGEDFSYTLRLVHLRQKTVETDIHMRILDSQGNLVQAQTLGSHEFSYLDDQQMRGSFRIPLVQLPGDYTLTFGMTEMLQGRVTQTIPFTVLAE